MNEVRAISVFVRAATLGSFRRAAADLGISPQAASHAVMQLEKSLGVRLFHRTTRKLSLTEEGQRRLQGVEPALAMLSSAIDDARRSGEEVAGPLRISAPTALGRTALWPSILEFAALYPDVQIDIRFDDHFSDLVSDRADVGFRGGSPPSEGAIARRLLPIQLIVCASQPISNGTARRKPWTSSMRIVVLDTGVRTPASRRRGNLWWAGRLCIGRWLLRSVRTISTLKPKRYWPAWQLGSLEASRPSHTSGLDGSCLCSLSI
ncbi:DNA-binding transcriptional LysR family regulator [Paraburkholderia sp. 32]